MTLRCSTDHRDAFQQPPESAPESGQSPSQESVRGPRLKSLKSHLCAQRQRRPNREGELAVGTINWDHAVLKRVLFKAIKRKHLTGTNPASLVEMPDPADERNRVLTMEEWEALYGAFPDRLKPVLLTAYRTAMRKGEITRLRWDQVDLSRGASPSRRPTRKPSKAGKSP
jgi:integrase